MIYVRMFDCIMYVYIYNSMYIYTQYVYAHASIYHPYPSDHASVQCLPTGLSWISPRLQAFLYLSVAEICLGCGLSIPTPVRRSSERNPSNQGHRNTSQMQRDQHLCKRLFAFLAESLQYLSSTKLGKEMSCDSHKDSDCSNQA